MPTTDLHTFSIGDKVTIDHPKARGQVFEVLAKLPKNYRVGLVDGSGRTCVVDPLMMFPHAEGRNGASVEMVAIPEWFNCGQTVRLRGKDGIYVVLKSTPRGYSVALLGGDGGSYFNAPAALLTAVKVDATVTE